MNVDAANASAPLPRLKLRKDEDRRLRRGHLWVFSNEVDTRKTPLTDFEPGADVVIEAANGRLLGTAYVNPHSLICARIVDRRPERPLNRSLIVHRLNVALSLRRRLYDEPFYRLVFGETDGLPGLIVDRYGDTLVAQLSTAGMEARREAVLEALDKVIHARAVIWRNDTPLRRLEGLETYVETAAGEPPEPAEVREGGLRFATSLTEGQKTGWFYDQRANRDRLMRYVADARVLDLFAYTGAWGLRAAAAGAREVVCVESSAWACERLRDNAAANGLSDRVTVVQADVGEWLKAARAEREHFDCVVLDPPAFIKSKKDFKQGLAGYRRINEAAIQVMAYDSILASCSCSSHLPEHELQRLVLQSARHLDRDLQLIEPLCQGPDHPVHPAIAETRYLKGLIGRILPR